MKRYQAVLMDMFDTLVNFRWDRLPLIQLDGQDVRTTSPLLYERLRSCCPGVTQEDFCRGFVGISRRVHELRNRDHREIPARDRFRMFFEHLGCANGSQTDHWLDACVAEHMRLLAPAMEFPESHRATVEMLGSRYRLAVISNFDYAPAVEAALEAHGIRRHFETVVVSADVGWCKPRPEIFSETFQRMQLAPADAVFVGDTPESDVVGAQGVGLDVIWIDHGTASLPPGVPSPTHIVPRFSEIVGLL